MNNFLLLTSALVLLQIPCMAGNMPAGARPAAMANAAVAIYDFWGLTHNQAGIAKTNKPMMAMYADNRYMIPELSQVSAGFVKPSGRGALGGSVCWFGNELYHEGNVGIAYARMFGGKLAAGVKLNYLFVSLGDGLGSTGNVAAEAGLLCEILPGLIAGAHVYNPGRAKIAAYNYLEHDERHPAVIRSGLSYSFSETLLVTIEAKKDIRHNARAKAGLEYGFGEQMTLRAGIATNPMENSFGFGLRAGGWQFDIASSYHYILGYSPQAGILYSW